MFKTRSYNTTSGSSKYESNRAASSCLRLVVDTVIAVSIFVVLALISSIIVLADLSLVIIAVISVVIVAVAVLLAELIIEAMYCRRPDSVKA